MTKIIGHRGAAGLALENTAEAIKTALRHHVDAIEVDIRRTKDNKLVLSHDRNLARISSYQTIIADHPLKELQSLTLHNKEHLLTLKEALRLCGATPIIVEIKEPGIAKHLIASLSKVTTNKVIITSLWHDELKIIRKLRPDIPILVRDMLSPFDIVATAHNIGATGINLNAWQMNPLTYWLAKRYNIDVMVYTVNAPFVARFLHALYPGIMICTNRPDKFSAQRKAWRKRTRPSKTLT